ncbi:MAG: phosphoribosylamine--glycine ligase [Nitriliruptoraceae bacterium]|jgi:phosphoribosylamine--glycine ligase
MGRTCLVLGGGGREHALAWRLSISASVDRVLTAPGNPGTAALGPRLSVDINDGNAVADLAQAHGVDLVVVGPEGPLVAGVADVLAARGIACFGPSAAAAELEGSKAFAKDVMVKAGAPTGGYVHTSDVDEAYDAIDRFEPPYVIKADGLAAGKGVRICATVDEARAAIDDALVRRVFGDAGASLVIEEFLHGPERSVFGVCDGTDVVLLQPAQDHKRALDGDEGLNTGGMGAFTPVAGFGSDRTDPLVDLIFLPVLRELASRGAPFRGLLYAGIVDTEAGPKLLEFNVRFGDPETQVVMPALASDLGELLWASATGSVRDVEVAWHGDAFVTVVLASEGYPESYPTGLVIEGVGSADALDDVTVFHAGTRDDEGVLSTSGGRVLAVTGRGDSLAAARAAAYDGVALIEFDGAHSRTDIGQPIG